MALYVAGVRGQSKRAQWCLFISLLAVSHFCCYPQGNWALLVLIPGWVGLYIFQDPVGLSKELSCEAGSLSCHHNPHRCFQSEVLRLYFPTLELWVAWSACSPVVPPGSSAHISKISDDANAGSLWMTLRVARATSLNSQSN